MLFKILFHYITSTARPPLQWTNLSASSLISAQNTAFVYSEFIWGLFTKKEDSDLKARSAPLPITPGKGRENSARCFIDVHLMGFPYRGESLCSASSLPGKLLRCQPPSSMPKGCVDLMPPARGTPKFSRAGVLRPTAPRRDPIDKRHTSGKIGKCESSVITMSRGGRFMQTFIPISISSLSHHLLFWPSTREKPSSFPNLPRNQPRFPNPPR